MLSGSLSRRYARALLEIGAEKKNYERLGDELGDIARLVENNKDLRAALQNPVFPLSKRKEVLAEVAKKLGSSPVMRNFVALLLERNRIGYLGDIHREYRQLSDEMAGRLRAEVRSARKLSEDDVARLKKAVEAATGKRVELQGSIDPTLIGGLVMRVGSVVYDGSIRAQLNKIRQQLLTER